MDFVTFVRKPFTVEAIEVTEENIAEIAEMIGSLHYKENGSPYIQVNRRLVPNLFRIYPGFWVTRMGDSDNIRCYSKRIFNNQFVRKTVDIKPWLEFFQTEHGEGSAVDDIDDGSTVEENTLDDVNVPLFTSSTDEA
jgi:hypothetical protein